MDIKEIQTIEHDVLVVGAGGAGIRAAIECAQLGLNTGMISKSLLGKAHTVMAEGGIAAAMGNVDKRDSWKIHFRDTMRGGKFLNQWRMAELHAKQAPDRVRELEEWGAVFDRTPDGLINQRNFGGHRYPRLAHVGDRTGLEMIRTLQDFCIHQGIATHMECTGLDLLLDNGRVSGMVAYWRETGRFVIFKAKAVIFATGGGGKAWQVTSNSWEYTGDGLGMAYRAGAELIDMEFTQFHPTGMMWPPSVKGTLVTESVRGEGGVLLNNKGERFMFKYIPEKFAAETASTEEEAARWLQGDKNARRPPELLTRDVVARAIKKEVEEGRGSPHDGAFLDIASRRPADFIKKKLPSMYHQFKELAEVDITKEAMEVGPTLHYFMGGIRVDSDTQATNIPGLFACGECGGGMHGANRLGGNSLSDLLVFGKLAGEGAANYIKKVSQGQIDESQATAIIRRATAFLNKEEGLNPFVVQEDLQRVMQRFVGIVRLGDELQKALSEIERVKKDIEKVKAHASPQFNPGWNAAIDLDNLIVTAQAVTMAALAREESRGGHSRIDFQGEREEGLTYNIILKKDPNGQMQLRKEPRAIPAKELADIAYAKIEDLEGKKLMAERVFRVWRGDKTGGEFVEYKVDLDKGMVVLDVIHRIQANQASDLACRWNCKAGKCGSCSMEINGHPRLSCMTRMNSFKEDEVITIRPLKTFPIIKDLVTDVSWNYAQNKRIAPFKPGPKGKDGNYRMYQRDVERVQEFRKCIECYLCQNVCHVLRDHDKKDKFVGPRFMIRLASLEMHPLDTEDRIEKVRDEYGSGLCNITKCCTDVCPEHIHITDNGIIPLKERVVDRFFDPVTIILHKIFGKKK